MSDPSGAVWVVERRWWPGLGHLARRYTRWMRRGDAPGSGSLAPNPLDVLDADVDVDGDDLLGSLVVGLVVVVLWVLLFLFGGWLFLPFALLGDLLLTVPVLVGLPALRALGVVPFTVRAFPGGDGDALAWRVRGVRRSAHAARGLAAIIASGDTPPANPRDLLRGVQD
ncbi:MAG: hypothetical protein U0Q15_07410 [Kineosporiaceae bacterium]